MAFSYSFHLSAKTHAVTTKAKVGQVSKHNLREYQSKDYDRNLIEILAGSSTSILRDMQSAYHREFDETVAKYNEGKRNDRKITDYFDKVSKSRNDVAAEIIIQLGDKDFWADKSMEDRKLMSHVFKDQLRSLEQLCPSFKIVSAVVHYDESSPHMHVVGIPIAEGYKNGMERQVAKTKVFTKESLEVLQTEMHKRAEKGMELTKEYNPHLFKEVKLKEKEKGRNYDIPKKSLTAYSEMLVETKELEKEKSQIKADLEDLKDEKKILETFVGSLKSLRESILQIIRDIRSAGGVKGPIERIREKIENKDRLYDSDFSDDRVILEARKLKSGQEIFIPATNKENFIEWEVGIPAYKTESDLLKRYMPFGVIDRETGKVSQAYGEEQQWSEFTPSTRRVMKEETEELFEDMDLSEELAERVKGYKDVLDQIDTVERAERSLTKQRGRDR